MADVEQSSSVANADQISDGAPKFEEQEESLKESSVAQHAQQGNTPGQAQDGESDAAEKGKETSTGASAASSALSAAADRIESPAQPHAQPTPPQATPANDLPLGKVAAVVDNEGNTPADDERPGALTEGTPVPASAEAPTATQPSPAQKAPSKIIVSLRRLSATFVPRPSLAGHLKEGEIEKIQKQKQEQEAQQEQQPLQTHAQANPVSPPDDPAVTATALVAEPQEDSKVEHDSNLNGNAAIKAADNEDSAPAEDQPASPTSRGTKYKHTVNDIRRRFSHSFKIPLVPVELPSEGDKEPYGAIEGAEQGKHISASHADTNQERSAPQPDPATTMPATTGTDGAGPLPPAHATGINLTPAETAPGGTQGVAPSAPNAASDEPKPTRRQLWQATLKDIFRIPISENKLRHADDMAHEDPKSRSDLKTQSAPPADTGRVESRKSTSIGTSRAQRRKSANPSTSAPANEIEDEPNRSTANLGFFAKVRQAIKDEFGKDFPASDTAQAQGKTRKKIGTVLVHWQGGQMVKAERLGKEAPAGGVTTHENVSGSGQGASAGGDKDKAKESKPNNASGKKKKNGGGDDDNDAPKGPPAVPTEHAIYAQDATPAPAAFAPAVAGPGPAGFSSGLM